MSYQELVDSVTPKENKWKNMMIAFFFFFVMGLLSELLVNVFDVNVMLIIWIVIASILTGMGVFDDFVDKFKMGVIIPITGFSHSITSSSIDYKSEGFITGIGSNYMKLAGSVILYGIVSATIFATIRGLLW